MLRNATMAVVPPDSVPTIKSVGKGVGIYLVCDDFAVFKLYQGQACREGCATVWRARGRGGAFLSKRRRGALQMHFKHVDTAVQGKQKNSTLLRVCFCFSVCNSSTK